MLNIEFWKTLKIKGEETIYEVSTEGRIRNKKTGKILKTQIDRLGYERVRLMFNGDKVSKSVHRLVAKTFIDNPNNLKEVNHIDGDKTNNCVGNLEFVTRSDNIRHAYEHGLINTEKGEDRYNSVYTEKQIRKVCKLIEKGLGNAEISKKTGVKSGAISQIRSGAAWKHISKAYELQRLKPKSDYSKYWNEIDGLLLRGYTKKQIKEIHPIEELTKVQYHSLITLRKKKLEKEGKL